jgi:GNAT superfamily N-acetyltransferase
MNDSLTLRILRPDEWSEVADLIHLSTNYWYQASGKPAIFAGDPSACELFPQVYEALDPDCCIVAVSNRTGHLVGSCFYHPRSTHISIGIVNVHPAYFGKGIARHMLHAVIEKADAVNLPLRLVSSAMNLDSFSLYTRAGFIPRQAYQDMLFTVPENGLGIHDPEIRSATTADIPAIVALEREISGLDREKDYHYFLENAGGIWHTSVLPAKDGRGLDGFLVSVAAPASNMLGPGIARTDSIATRLIRSELDHHRGRTPVFLIPVDHPELVSAMYALGAKNCEIHFAQVRGAWTPPQGVVMPTFLPETG